MYIEFSLPQGSAGQAAQQADYIISRELREWSEKYEISYRTKHVKYFKRVTFDDESHYAFFAMTWNPGRRYHALSRWRIVSDPNNKTKFDSRV
jgi:hypothetical protein